MLSEQYGICAALHSWLRGECTSRILFSALCAAGRSPAVGPADVCRSAAGLPRPAISPGPNGSVEEQRGQWIAKDCIPWCFDSARSVYFSKTLILLTAHISAILLPFFFFCAFCFNVQRAFPRQLPSLEK